MCKKIHNFILRHVDRSLFQLGFSRKVPLDKDREFVLLVDQARQEWQWAKKISQEAKEKNLIDQAIFGESAAERKYVHLLKKAAQEGVRADAEMVVYLALIGHNSEQRGR